MILGVRFDDPDAQRWLGYHGEIGENSVRLECKCDKFKHGRCTIYDSRPEVCRVYAVGSAGCIEAIKHCRSFKAERIFKLMEAEHGEKKG